MKRLGVDVGSTTLKCAVVDETGALCFARYMRHYSKIDQRLGELLRQVAEQFPGESMEVSLSGSAGMGLAEEADLPFV